MHHLFHLGLHPLQLVRSVLLEGIYVLLHPLLHHLFRLELESLTERLPLRSNLSSLVRVLLLDLADCLLDGERCTGDSHASGSGIQFRPDRGLLLPADRTTVQQCPNLCSSQLCHVGRSLLLPLLHLPSHLL